MIHALGESRGNMNNSNESMIIGTVIGCVRLNVRKEPDENADVVDIVPVDAELNVDSNGGNEQFYFVRTPDGIDGYCMKKFVDIKG